MVLERIFSPVWLERRILFSIVLGGLYSIIGIVLARLIFGANSGIVSIMFLTLLVVPTLRKLTSMEELREEQEKTFSLKNLYKDNKLLFEIYGGLFVGIFFTYFFSTFLLPQFGVNVFTLFREQLFLDPALAGRATFSTGLLFSILENNWLVLLATFMLALLIGEGSFFFVAWNASAWGAIFGYRALSASLYAGESSIYYAAIILGIVGLHVILEGSAYILAAISGSVISSDALRKTSQAGTFLSGLVLGVFFLLGWRMLLTRVAAPGIMIFLSSILVALFFLFLIGKMFKDNAHREVFLYNYWLFIIAILVFFVGVLVETAVLGNVPLLHQIYQQSALYAGI